MEIEIAIEKGLFSYLNTKHIRCGTFALDCMQNISQCHSKTIRWPTAYTYIVCNRMEFSHANKFHISLALAFLFIPFPFRSSIRPFSWQQLFLFYTIPSVWNFSGKKVLILTYTFMEFCFSLGQLCRTTRCNHFCSLELSVWKLDCYNDDNNSSLKFRLLAVCLFLLTGPFLSAQ